jgi:hypothetical protein
MASGQLPWLNLLLLAGSLMWSPWRRSEPQHQTRTIPAAAACRLQQQKKSSSSGSSSGSGSGRSRGAGDMAAVRAESRKFWAAVTSERQQATSRRDRREEKESSEMTL